LGRHSKTSRIRITKGAALAAPTLAGVAAAFCISPPAIAAPVRGFQGVGPLARQVAVAAGRGPAALTAATRYRVRPGDTLSAIARHFYGDPDAWPVIYWRNHASIRWADDLYAGQELSIPPRPGRIPAAPSALQPAAVAPPPVAPPPQAAEVSSPAAPQSADGGLGGSFAQCVIARESGGNAQIMNATGHYGLYQFSASTWAAYGGNPADFGDASVAEQNQVFANAIAAGGASNWAPYDGC
jgi:LysM repeat protein